MTRLNSKLKKQPKPTNAQIIKIRELRDKGYKSDQISRETGCDFDLINFIILHNLLTETAINEAYSAPVDDSADGQTPSYNESSNDNSNDSGSSDSGSSDSGGGNSDGGSDD